MSIKKIIALVLTVAVVIIALGAISSFAGKETERISPWKFSRGALDENGTYVETKQSLYTKEMFECSGLSIEQDFESRLTYDVYLYDYSGNLIDSERGLCGKYKIKSVSVDSLTEDETFYLVKYARIVIHPDIPADVDEDDFVISYLDIYDIVNELNISVYKDQDYIYNTDNLFKDDGSMSGFIHSDISLIDGAVVNNSPNYLYDYCDVYFKLSESLDSSSDISVLLGCKEGSVKLSDKISFIPDMKPDVWYKTTIKTSVGFVDEGYLTYLDINLPAGSECYVFGYNK